MHAKHSTFEKVKKKVTPVKTQALQFSFLTNMLPFLPRSPGGIHLPPGRSFQVFTAWWSWVCLFKVPCDTDSSLLHGKEKEQSGVQTGRLKQGLANVFCKGPDGISFRPVRLIWSLSLCFCSRAATTQKTHEWAWPCLLCDSDVS